MIFARSSFQRFSNANSRAFSTSLERPLIAVPDLDKKPSHDAPDIQLALFDLYSYTTPQPGTPRRKGVLVPNVVERQFGKLRTSLGRQSKIEANHSLISNALGKVAETRTQSRKQQTPSPPLQYASPVIATSTTSQARRVANEQNRREGRLYEDAVMHGLSSQISQAYRTQSQGPFDMVLEIDDPSGSPDAKTKRIIELKTGIVRTKQADETHPSRSFITFQHLFGNEPKQQGQQDYLNKVTAGVDYWLLVARKNAAFHPTQAAQIQLSDSDHDVYLVPRRQLYAALLPGRFNISANEARSLTDKLLTFSPNQLRQYHLENKLPNSVSTFRPDLLFTRLADFRFPWSKAQDILLARNSEEAFQAAHEPQLQRLIAQDADFRKVRGYE